MNTPRISDKPGRWLALYAPYSTRFVTEMKNDIPVRDRRWCPIRRCWLVDRKYGDYITELVILHFDQVCHE